MAFNKFNNNNNNLNNTTGQNGFSYYSTSPANMIKILILEKKEYVLEAIRLCLVANKENTLYVKASIYILYSTLRAMLEKDWIEKAKQEDLKKLKSQVESNNYKELILAWESLDSYMYEKGLTKIDFGQAYDSTDPAIEDEKNAL